MNREEYEASSRAERNLLIIIVVGALSVIANVVLGVLLALKHC